MFYLYRIANVIYLNVRNRISTTRVAFDCRTFKNSVHKFEASMNAHGEHKGRWLKADEETI